MLLKYGIKRHPPKIFESNNGRRSLVERYRARHKPPEKKPIIKPRIKPRPITISGDPKEVRQLTLEELHGGLARKIIEERKEMRKKTYGKEVSLENNGDITSENI